MTQDLHHHHEVVTRMIRRCHQDKVLAMKIYKQVAAGKQQKIDLPDRTVSLSHGQVETFVERFSAEVGPEMWETKSGKH